MSEHRAVLRRFTAFLAVAALVLVVVFQMQLVRRNHTLDDIERDAHAIKVFVDEIRCERATPAEEKRLGLHCPPAPPGDTSLADSQAVLEAVHSISRIERFLCGGPCPDPKTGQP